MSDPTPQPPENVPQPNPDQLAQRPQPKPDATAPLVTRDPGVPEAFEPLRVRLRAPHVLPKGVAVEIEMRVFTVDGLEETYHYAHLINSALSAPNAEHANRQFMRYLDIAKEDIMRDMYDFFLQRLTSDIKFLEAETDDNTRRKKRGFFSEPS